MIAQAYSGVMWRRESAEIPLSVYPTTLCDYTTGMHLLQGILMALIARNTTGEGQKVQVTMYDSMLHMQMQEAATQLNRGYEMNWASMPLSGVFPTKDGAVCMVGAFKKNPLHSISLALDLPEDLSAAGGVRDPGKAVRATPGPAGHLPGSVRHQHHRALGRPAGGTGHPVRPGAFTGRGARRRADRGEQHDPQMDHPTAGRVRALAPPIRLSETPSQVRLVAPTLGQHNREVLRRTRIRRRGGRRVDRGRSAPMTVAAAAPKVDEIRLDIDGHVARVTIDRQHVLNAIDETAAARCNEIWDRIERDPSVHVVVVTGAGDRAFCAGADMSTGGAGKNGLAYWADLDPNGFAGLSLRRTLDVPVIARVNGYALGGGMEIMLGCDLVIAAETAQFGLTEPRVGRLALDGGIVHLAPQNPARAGNVHPAHRPPAPRGGAAPDGPGQRGRRPAWTWTPPWTGGSTRPVGLRADVACGPSSRWPTAPST